MDHLKGKLSAEEMSEFNLFLDHLLGESKVAANNDGGRDDDAENDEASREKMREFLKSRGMADNFIEKAVDMLPRAGTEGGMGGRAADRAMARGGSVDMTSFDREFGGGHIVGGFGSPADMAFDHGPPAPIADADLAAFNRDFPESERLA